MLVKGKLKICLIQADSINVPLQTENFVNRDKIVQYNTDSYLFNICSCLFIFVLLFLLFFFYFFCVKCLSYYSTLTRCHVLNGLVRLFYRHIFRGYFDSLKIL